MNEEKKENSRILKLADTMLIALAGLLGQMITFMYELGHARAFGWPVGLIEVSFNNMLAVTAFLISICFIMMVIMEWCSTKFGEKRSIIAMHFITIFIIFMGSPFSLISILGAWFWLVIILLAMVTFVSATFLVYPAISLTKGKVSTEKDLSWVNFFHTSIVSRKFFS
jgi:hypothetical protein